MKIFTYFCVVFSANGQRFFKSNLFWQRELQYEKLMVSNWTYLNCIFDEIILSPDKAKSAGIALAMASIFNAVWGQKKPS